MISAIATLAIAFLIVGLICYLVSLTPFDARLKQAFYVVVIVLVCIYLLQHFAGGGSVKSISWIAPDRLST